MPCLTPDYYCDSISDVPLTALKERGIRAVICDLDNTLDSHETQDPSEKALAFLTRLRTMGFDVCIISNGKHARVARYLKDLSLPYIAKAGKPKKKSYQKALRLLKCKPEYAAFVGDQIFTDTWGANRVGLTTVLVEPIQSFETPLFYPKRALEKFVKAKLTKE